ncbi:unnamed protein product [Phytophthora fragariaefolia]|uniref:Unnamed protein product n=1 Tax=Phytophthora fragariaefolia TaxID=1490495 RepID=A0A9W7CYZ2_9STRA|nr:unnamed protein product [Phytophthora fragariaefolia]
MVDDQAEPEGSSNLSEAEVGDEGASQEEHVGGKESKVGKEEGVVRKPASRGNDAGSAAEDGDCEDDAEAGDKVSTRQKRMVYRAEENCLVMQAVLGDNGIFNRGKKESKADRWVKITEHLTEVVNKKINPDSLRKHINKLEKTYKKEANADRARSGTLTPCHGGYVYN